MDATISSVVLRPLVFPFCAYHTSQSLFPPPCAMYQWCSREPARFAVSSCNRRFLLCLPLSCDAMLRVGLLSSIVVVPARSVGQGCLGRPGKARQAVTATGVEPQQPQGWSSHKLGSHKLGETKQQCVRNVVTGNVNPFLVSLSSHLWLWCLPMRTSTFSVWRKSLKCFPCEYTWF